MNGLLLVCFCTAYLGCPSRMASGRRCGGPPGQCESSLRGAPAGAGRETPGLLARWELLLLGFHNKNVTHGVSTDPASSPVGVPEPK